jgi:hypothetical protein
METISKQAILNKTHYGLNIYAHILRLYFPNQTVLKLVDRDCGLCRNPFNANKQTLHVWIDSSHMARHEDTQNAIPAGDAFDFARLHYKQSGDELLQTINKDMHLRIGEKFDFYKNRNSNTEIQNQSNHNNHTNHGSDIGEARFSFFKAPISNTHPYKAISLPDAFRYIVGNYAKQRTEKLRAFSDPRKARIFKAANFDYCTFSGTFTSRSDKALIRHSGLLCLDFDHLNNVRTLFDRLLRDEYFETQLLFRSPSGDGLKWVISVDAVPSEHTGFFTAVANYVYKTYGVTVDKSGRDISRACFLPHDPDAYLNPAYNLSTG